MRVMIQEDPYNAADAGKPWNRRGLWPCRWIACPDTGNAPFVAAYRLHFTQERAATVRAHVSADERYELFLDGVRIGRGSERGDGFHWFFETYDLPLAEGDHVLVARVWTLGERAPFAQMSVRHGFLLSPQEPEEVTRIGTGVAGWEAKRLGGYVFHDPSAAWGTGANLTLEGSRFDWGFEKGEGDRWQPALVQEEGSTASRNDRPPTRLLRPAALPPQKEAPWPAGAVRLVADLNSAETHAIPIRASDNLSSEAEAWQALLRGTASLTVPAGTRRRILLDLEDYVCAYPEVTVSGGAGSALRVHWQESLFNEPEARTKGNRDAVEGKYFVTIWHLTDGIGDTFRPDGGANRRFETLWWQCGRYVEVVVETAAEPLTIERFTLRETRYPLEMESAFQASDPHLAGVMPLALRALQMCAHETYMDCPYYEQLMYIGDTRLEVLTTYALTRDDRLPRKALRMFDASRQLSGLTQSRYPTRVFQSIPPFSLWWVAMVHDFALWRGDQAFVRRLMPGVRGVIDHYLSLRTADGLIGAADGWNFLDWVPAWESGVPPDGASGVSGAINWQVALALGLVAELEAWMEEPELALRAERLASDLAECISAAFWVEERGLFADDRTHAHFSEHSQCLALLSHRLEPVRRERVARGLLEAADLERTTIYFTHYLFEAYSALGRTDALLERMALWFDLKAQGLKTTIEMPEPTRSDCHAWGAHPLYHYFASILGIRPVSIGFEEVRIAPQLGPLTSAGGVLVHPRGQIEVDLRVQGGTLQGTILLPEGVRGTFIANGEEQALHAGKNILE